ncbi:MAG TPA: FAD-dependent oxidoreductase [Acetobacteraceae bacterium]|nr:FAD-dependent oxidoreductase [Acetobacteraceae bacterium]
MRILIVGGGVIGASIAYHLAARGADVAVIERTAIACAASGKSGGFLAMDWCDGTALMQLARRSFALHAELAEARIGEWGYRRMTTYAGVLDRSSISVSHRPRPAWLAPDIAMHGQLGSMRTTAQVQPAAFTVGMMRAAEARGAELRLGNVTGLLRRGENVVGVELDSTQLEGDAVVIAMGPWSVLATEWIPFPPVFGLKGHSMVFETGAAIPSEAAFLEYEETDGSILSPEIFPRADGTTYVCAISSESPLPTSPAQVVPDVGAIDRLKALCARISPVLATSRVVASQACFRPVTQDGLPLIGPIQSAPGAYIATGHSVWGILNAPATGEAMAELILDRSTRSVDLSVFDPARLAPLHPRRFTRSRPSIPS